MGGVEFRTSLYAELCREYYYFYFQKETKARWSETSRLVYLLPDSIKLSPGGLRQFTLSPMIGLRS